MTLPDFLAQDPYGSIRLTGHRIGLAHLLHYYHEGYSPEMLHCEYPTLSRALIDQVLAFYQANQAEVDAYLAQCRAEIEQQRAAAVPGPTAEELRRRMAARRPAEGA